MDKNKMLTKAIDARNGEINELRHLNIELKTKIKAPGEGLKIEGNMVRDLSTGRLVSRARFVEARAKENAAFEAKIKNNREKIATLMAEIEEIKAKLTGKIPVKEPKTKVDNKARARAKSAAVYEVTSNLKRVTTQIGMGGIKKK